MDHQSGWTWNWIVIILFFNVFKKKYRIENVPQNIVCRESAGDIESITYKKDEW